MNKNGDNMKRIIINYDDDITTEYAMAYVSKIMEMGRVSHNNTCYCLASKFDDQTIVLSELTKNGTDTFKVYKKENNE